MNKYNNLVYMCEIMSKKKIDENQITIYGPEEEQPFIFISYCSKDKDIVINKIIRRLVNEYNLRIYYDDDFENHPEHWVERLQDVLESSDCKAILSFISKEYLGRKACMLEVLKAKSFSVSSVHNNKNLTIIPIVIDSNIIEFEKTTPSDKSNKEDISDDYKKIFESVLRNEKNIKDDLYNFVEEIKDEKNLTRDKIATGIKNAIKMEDYNLRRHREDAEFYEKLIEAIKDISPDIINDNNDNDNIDYVDDELNNKNENIKDVSKFKSENIDNDDENYNLLVDEYEEYGGKIGLFVRTKMNELFNDCKFSNDEINQLLDPKYCSKTFKLNYPFLSKEMITSKVKDRDVKRYYSEPYDINGEKYYLTSQWIKKNVEPLILWISELEKKKGYNVTEPITQSNFSEDNIYEVSSNNYDARYKITNNEIIILKDSKINYSFDYTPKKIYRNLIDKKKITADGILLDDVGPLPRSTAGKLIKGISTSGADLLDEKRKIK